MASITSRNADYAAWYVDLILGAQLADYAPIKGCMVIRPRGYAIWEKIQSQLDLRFKECGHQNAYFPLFLPQSFIEKESQHVEGFAPELAVVTHAGGNVLEEPYVIRPTSETIMWSMFRKWIHSYRDLPLKINQWCNVVRWEKRTRLFLRTSEFLWQEGHTAHETAEEAQKEARMMLEVYRSFMQDVLALPVLVGYKTPRERFAGARDTYCLEALMQDGKALQAGTSHDLGQNFSKAFEVHYQDQNGTLCHPYSSSWGVSTRLIGALIMVHGDDKGLVLPPRIAPHPVVCVLISQKKNREEIWPYARAVWEELSQAGLSSEWDDDEQNSVGWRLAEWELRGIPLRLEMGPRDFESQSVTLCRRDSGEKITIPRDQVLLHVHRLLEDIQNALFERAKHFREDHTACILEYASFVQHFAQSRSGFVWSPWCGHQDCEKQIKEETKATIRLLPFDGIALHQGHALDLTQHSCLYCSQKAQYWALFAQAY